MLKQEEDESGIVVLEMREKSSSRNTLKKENGAEKGNEMNEAIPESDRKDEGEVQSGSIAGRVFDKLTYRPITGASASVTGGLSTKTDERGTFLFSDLKPGIYRITVSEEGYVFQSCKFSIVAGETTRLESFHLIPLCMATDNPDTEEEGEEEYVLELEEESAEELEGVFADEAGDEIGGSEIAPEVTEAEVSVLEETASKEDTSLSIESGAASPVMADSESAAMGPEEPSAEFVEEAEIKVVAGEIIEEETFEVAHKGIADHEEKVSDIVVAEQEAIEAEETAEDDTRAVEEVMPTCDSADVTEAETEVSAADEFEEVTIVIDEEASGHAGEGLATAVTNAEETTLMEWATDSAAEEAVEKHAAEVDVEEEVVGEADEGLREEEPAAMLQDVVIEEEKVAEEEVREEGEIKQEIAAEVSIAEGKILVEGPTSEVTEEEPAEEIREEIEEETQEALIPEEIDKETTPFFIDEEVFIPTGEGKNQAMVAPEETAPEDEEAREEAEIPSPEGNISDEGGEEPEVVMEQLSEEEIFIEATAEEGAHEKDETEPLVANLKSEETYEDNVIELPRGVLFVEEQETSSDEKTTTISDEEREAMSEEIDTAGTADFTGVVRVLPNPVYRGLPINIIYTLKNLMCENPSDLTLRISVTNPDTGMNEEAFEVSVKCKRGDSQIGGFIASTVSYEASFYRINMETVSNETASPQLIAVESLAIKTLC